MAGFHVGFAATIAYAGNSRVGMQQASFGSLLEWHLTGTLPCRLPAAVSLAWATGVYGARGSYS